MKLFDQIKKSIADFKEWMSPWRPIQVEIAPTGCNDLNFTQDNGKRFIPKRKKLLNQAMPYIISYAKREFLKKYHKECDDWSLLTDFRDYISVNLYSPELRLKFYFDYPIKKLGIRVDTYADTIFEVVEITDWMPDGINQLRDSEGRLCQDERHYLEGDIDLFPHPASSPSID